MTAGDVSLQYKHKREEQHHTNKEEYKASIDRKKETSPRLGSIFLEQLKPGANLGY
jgi:hypothetical protein